MSNIYLCLNAVHLQWQIWRNSSAGVFGSSEEEVFERGGGSGRATVDHSQVITCWFTSELVQNVGARPEEVGIRHSARQVDWRVRPPVRLSLRPARSHDPASSWHPDPRRLQSYRNVFLCLCHCFLTIKCSRLAWTFRHKIGTFPVCREQPLLHQQF